MQNVVCLLMINKKKNHTTRSVRQILVDNFNSKMCLQFVLIWIYRQIVVLYILYVHTYIFCSCELSYHEGVTLNDNTFDIHFKHWHKHTFQFLCVCVCVYRLGTNANWWPLTPFNWFVTNFPIHVKPHTKNQKPLM